MRSPCIVRTSHGDAVQYVLDCPECDSPMILGEFEDKLRYSCTINGCIGSHGAHLNGKPLGTPANARTRKARILAHAAFDRLWENGKFTRNQAYLWLSNMLEIQEAHIGDLNLEQCRRIVEAVKSEFPELFPFSDDVP